MSEYYAVIRSSSELKHYGVKGMKWGVRKAIEQKSSVPKSKAYNKAKKKLASNYTEDGIYTGKVTLTKKQKDLESQWKDAVRARKDALAVRNKSFIGSMGYGKKSVAYEQANKAAQDAFGAFVDSMSETQRKKYHDRYLY